MFGLLIAVCCVLRVRVCSLCVTRCLLVIGGVLFVVCSCLSLLVVYGLLYVVFCVCCLFAVVCSLWFVDLCVLFGVC